MSFDVDLPCRFRTFSFSTLKLDVDGKSSKTTILEYQEQKKHYIMAFQHPVPRHRHKAPAGDDEALDVESLSVGS